MDKYRKFEFASLRNSKLTDGFWGKRTDNYMEIIQCMLEALLCPTNSARLINFEIAAGERKESFYGANWSDGDCYKFLEGCLYVYQRTKDEKVKEIVDKYIPLIINSAEPDGYINTQITLTSMNAVQGREVFNTQKAGAYTANYGNISGGDAYQALYDTNPDAKITCITDVIQPDGTHACETSVGFYGMYVIPKSSVETEEELRGILSFFDGLCSDECVDIEMKGVEGVHYKYNDKNEFEWIDKSKFDAESKGISSFNVAPLIELTMSLNGFYNASTYYDFQTKEGVVDYMPVNSWFAANSDDAAVDTVVKQAATNYVMGEASAEDVSAAVKEWLNGGGQSHADDWTEQYSKLAK